MFPFGGTRDSGQVKTESFINLCVAAGIKLSDRLSSQRFVQDFTNLILLRNATSQYF